MRRLSKRQRLSLASIVLLAIGICLAAWVKDGYEWIVLLAVIPGVCLAIASEGEP
jgi:hypothetical protein